MGRDAAGLRIDKKKASIVSEKSNGISHIDNHDTVEDTYPKISVAVESVEDNNSGEEYCEKQEVVAVKKNKNYDVAEATTEKKQDNSDVPETNKIDSRLNATQLNISPKPVNKSQTNSPSGSRQRHQYYERKYLDDEDNWSMASSAAASTRTVRSQITVPVAPTFRSDQRAERRKEFYKQLERKQQAREAEKMEYEARTKEEQEAAIKQLRQNMVYKANPVPNFYREGPPPKAQLKKLPVTRAISPKITRRKSCGDAISSVEKKEVCPRAVRYSIGTYNRAGILSFSAKTKTKETEKSKSSPSSTAKVATSS
jgi:hypothetical protein